MQTLLQTFYDSHLYTFINGFFWIDLGVICVFTLFFYYTIIRRSTHIVQRNTLRNAELLKFRTEVYHFYEKNFFI